MPGQFSAEINSLAITRKLCALLGGEIRVTSKVGQGSSFIVDIPAQLARDVSQENSEPTDDVAQAA
ncbi:MAG: hypothetical protein H6893_00900 [Brucellaceae bacterium]|nr:hypothetical protein [Brucellaceae bacterium]